MVSISGNTDRYYSLNDNMNVMHRPVNYFSTEGVAFTFNIVILCNTAQNSAVYYYGNIESRYNGNYLGVALRFQ